MKKSIYTVLALLLSVQAYSWGPTGHRVIGQIAENHLTKKARKEVVKLLGKDGLAEVSTWMDEIKSDDRYDHTHSWHYTTIPEGTIYETRNNDEGQLVEQINKMKITLSSEDSAHETKVQALKILVHLIGDLHQPLHVGNGEDRGGNQVKINFFYEGTNLHRVWDSDMINHKLFSYSELACISDQADTEQIEIWEQGTTADWADECLQYRPQIYNFGDPDRVGYEYVYQNWDLVKQQLLKGGIRLAAVLNALYA